MAAKAGQHATLAIHDVQDPGQAESMCGEGTVGSRQADSYGHPPWEKAKPQSTESLQACKAEAPNITRPATNVTETIPGSSNNVQPEGLSCPSPLHHFIKGSLTDRRHDVWQCSNSSFRSAGQVHMPGKKPSSNSTSHSEESEQGDSPRSAPF